MIDAIVYADAVAVTKDPATYSNSRGFSLDDMSQQLLDKYVLLAHLQHHSISVTVGDIITPRHPLGRCGNSGNSSDPHLHMQVQTTRNPLLGRAVPFSFRGHQLPASATTIASTFAATK